MTEPSNNAAGVHGTRSERYAAGRQLRQRVPRESHAQCPPADAREPIAILTESDGARLPELLPIRYQRMAKSPFTFLRGAAAVMAHDLAQLPSIGIRVQACGDCHLLNFGVFDTPESQVLFDINDFDETLPGVDFTVDLKRLAVSVAVAASDAQMPERKAKSLAHATAQAYRQFILELAGKSPLQIWHTQMEIDRGLDLIGDEKLRGKLRSTIVKAKNDLDEDDNFPHLATSKDGIALIEDRPPLIYHFPPDAEGDQKIMAKSLFSIYHQSLLPERRALAGRYELRDIAMKVVGVGSVGTFCAIGLFMSADSEPLFLQVKQALPSVLEKIAAARRIGQSRQPGRRRAARAPGGQRYFPQLDIGPEDEPVFLRPPAQEPAARLNRRSDRGQGARCLRQSLRTNARPRPCPDRRPRPHRRIHG
jgi:hypothetical protein